MIREVWILALSLIAIGMLLVLLGCGGTAGPVELAPGERVLVRAGAGPGATLSIPRYKLFQHPDTAERIWVALSLENGGEDTFFTGDGGATWSALGVMRWEMHMSLAGNDDGYVHFIDRGSPAAQYHRVHGQLFETGARASFQDYGAQTTSGNIAVNGHEVVVFTRNRDDNQAPVTWHRSNDNGDTWQSGKVPETGSSGAGLHRIGSCVIDGRITLVYWKESGGPAGDSITLYRWNGEQFARLDGTFVTRTSNPYTRQFAVTQDTNGLIHLAVWDVMEGRRVLRHSSRALHGSWSVPQTVARWENDDIHPQLSAHGDRVLLLYLYNPRSTRSERAQVYFNLWQSGTGWRADGTPLYAGERAGARYPIAPQQTASGSPFVPVVWTQGGAVHYLPLEVR